MGKQQWILAVINNSIIYYFNVFITNSIYFMRKTLYYDEIQVSKNIVINKTNNSQECRNCRYNCCFKKNLVPKQVY